MKKLFILLTFVTLSLQSFAGEIKIINRGATFSVLYRSGLVCDTKITIHDADGNEIFREVLQDMCNIVRSYNFSKLPYGDYQIKASNELETIKTKVSYSEPKTEATTPRFHVTKLDVNKYLLMVPKSGSNKIAISIMNDNAQILYTKRENTNGDFARVFYIKDADPTDVISFSVKSVN
jgi:hypothetical protein